MTHYQGDYTSLQFLVVDDRPFLRNLIQNMLMRCMARDIKHASDGAAAISALTTAAGYTDCVICDWNMTPVDGLELLRAIRSGEVPNTPRDMHFIMLTGYADEHIVRTAKALDVDAYLVKPISFDKIVSVVNAVFLKKVTLKSPDAYRSKDIATLPGAAPLLEPVSHAAPWVVLSKIRPKDKKSAARNIEKIRHEGNGPLKRQVIHQECIDLDKILPGKILAENIYADNGTLLLASGTLLSGSMMTRLRELAMMSSESVRLTVGDFGD